MAYNLITFRIGAGKHLLLADLHQENSDAAAKVLSEAGLSTILKVDLYGTALVLEEFGNVIESGGSGVVIDTC